MRSECGLSAPLGGTPAEVDLIYRGPWRTALNRGFNMNRRGSSYPESVTAPLLLGK